MTSLHKPVLFLLGIGEGNSFEDVAGDGADRFELFQRDAGFLCIPQYQSLRPGYGTSGRCNEAGRTCPLGVPAVKRTSPLMRESENSGESAPFSSYGFAGELTEFSGFQ